MDESFAIRSMGDGADRVRHRRASRQALEQALPEIRIVAEGILAEASAIDLLAVGGEGELIAIRLAEPGGDLAMLTRLLSDLCWLRSRREDLLRLATGNGIDPSAEPRGLLVAPSVGRETRAAVDNFLAATIELWRERPGRAGDRLALRIERLDPLERASEDAPGGRSRDFDEARLAEPDRPADRRGPGPSTNPKSPSADPPRTPLGRTAGVQAGRSDQLLTDAPSPSAFRTGLCAADLAAPIHRSSDPRRELAARPGPGTGDEHPAPGNSGDSSAIFRHG